MPMIQQFHQSEFQDVVLLADRKVRKGQSVTVVIPARNEAQTIGPIVEKVRRALIEQAPLVDELLVMDGGSEDATAQVARDAGARVVGVDDVMPGNYLVHGKGLALWKSLFVSKGSLIACLDADITNFDPCFVYGVIAPLLLDDNLSFAKAYYERPLVMDDRVFEGQGGRVTEILVRPILATFYPALSELYQPLAGEYAFRRSVIEAVPFFSGYGVEIGLLIDIVNQCGLSHIVQVNMGSRRHRNRSVHDLGKMAFGILHAVLMKLTEEQRLTIHTPVGSKMISPVGETFEHFELIEEVLPPAATRKSEDTNG